MSNLDTGGTVRKFALVVLTPVPIIMLLQTARLIWMDVSGPMPAHFTLIHGPSVVVMGALFITMESFFGCLFIGVPIHLLLKRLRYSSPWIYVSVGIAIGIMLALIGYLRVQFSPKIDGMLVEHDEISPILGPPIASCAFWWWFCDHGGQRRWRSEDVPGAINGLRFTNPPAVLIREEHILSTAENVPPKPGDGLAGFCAAVFACAAFGVVESLVACTMSLVLDAFSGTRDVMPIGMLISTLAILAYLVVIVSFVASLITSFAFFTLVGLPVHFLLVWRKARNLPAYLIAGFFANAAVTMGLMLVPSFRSAFFHLRMFTIPDFAVGGAAGARRVLVGGQAGPEARENNAMTNHPPVHLTVIASAAEPRAKQSRTRRHPARDGGGLNDRWVNRQTSRKLRCSVLGCFASGFAALAMTGLIGRGPGG